VQRWIPPARLVEDRATEQHTHTWLAVEFFDELRMIEIRRLG
jgi:hypothetical protein